MITFDGIFELTEMTRLFLKSSLRMQNPDLTNKATSTYIEITKLYQLQQLRYRRRYFLLVQPIG